MKSVKWLGMAGAAAVLMAGIVMSVQAVNAQTTAPPTAQTQQASSSTTAASGDAQAAGPHGGSMMRGGGPRGGRGLEAQQAVTVTGTLKSYTVSRDGDYDGFSLADGTLVRVNPTDGLKVKALFAVGDSVQVQGFQRQDPAGATQIEATAISSGSKTYAPDKPTMPAVVTTTVSAAITQLSTDPNGNLDGFYLGDQTLVRLQMRDSSCLKAQLVVGAQVEVTGDKRVGTSGLTVIRAQEIKIGGQAVFTAAAQSQGQPGPRGDRGDRGDRGPRNPQPSETQTDTTNPSQP